MMIGRNKAGVRGHTNHNNYEYGEGQASSLVCTKYVNQGTNEVRHGTGSLTNPLRVKYEQGKDRCHG
jgi:hypothetical protein